MYPKQYQLAARLCGTLACAVQTYVFGASIGMAVCHGTILYCIWFNRERTK